MNKAIYWCVIFLSYVLQHFIRMSWHSHLIQNIRVKSPFESNEQPIKKKNKQTIQEQTDAEILLTVQRAVDRTWTIVFNNLFAVAFVQAIRFKFRFGFYNKANQYSETLNKKRRKIKTHLKWNKKRESPAWSLV